MRMLRLPSGGLDTRLLSVCRSLCALMGEHRRPPGGFLLCSLGRPALPTYLPTWLPTHLLPSDLLPTYLPTYLPTHLVVPTYLPTYVPAYLPGRG